MRMIVVPAGGEARARSRGDAPSPARRARRSARPSRSAARRARAHAGSRPSAAPPSAAARPTSARQVEACRLGELRRSAAVEPPAADEPGLGRLGAEEDVLGDGQLRDDRRLLRDRRDPVLERLARRAERDRLAVEQHAAAVGRERAGDDPAERRLAGAVLADERVDRAAANRERRRRRAPGRRRSAWRRPGARGRRARLASAIDGRMLTGPLGLELRGVRLRDDAAVRQALEHVDAAAALAAVLTALITHCMPSLPSVAGRCMTVPYHSPGLTALRPTPPPP